jgi:acetyl esterase
MKSFLDLLAAQPTPDLRAVPPSVSRGAFAAMMHLVGPKNVPIGKVTNLSCPGPAGEIPLRCYTPVAASAESLPSLLFFHGGGFILGNLDTHDGLCRMLANEAGVRVIAVDYRLAPENKFPSAIEDALAALHFVEANAAELGVDANRLAVGGDSAGATLAAVTAQLAKEKSGSALAFQMLLFPATQLGGETNSLKANAVGFFLERKTLDWFGELYLPAGANLRDPRISPLLAQSLSGLPPAYLMTAEFDPLHDDGIRYAEALKAAGVEVTIADYAGLVHDFIYFQTIVPQAAQALKDAAQALRKALTTE